MQLKLKYDWNKQLCSYVGFLLDYLCFFLVSLIILDHPLP